ncbi:MAG: transcriptional regulator NrdR [Chitinophagales bacterium]
MKCPHCQQPESRVLDSRTSDDGSVIRRRRECIICKRRFTTYERIEDRPLLVVKREGNREVFNRDKLIRGITKATEKRLVSSDTIESTVAEIEKELKDEFDREVSSQEIGEKVMDRLRFIDEVAYVRFASVYRQFTDVDGFVKTVQQLKNQETDDLGED